METPVVTVLVATYNRARYIAAALKSVQEQTFGAWELVILDDGSTDETEDVVEPFISSDPRIRYYRQPENVGIAKNRNTGLAQAQGAYVAILDSDDIWLDKEKLEKQVKFLEANPEHALVGSFARTIDADGNATGSIEYETTDEGIRSRILMRNQFAQSTLLYRLSAAREAGGYDEHYAVNDDYDLWLKIGAKHKLANLPEYTTGYRIHEGGITKERKLKAADEHLLIIQKHRKGYPNYAAGALKAYARILLALVGL